MLSSSTSSSPSPLYQSVSIHGNRTRQTIEDYVHAIEPYILSDAVEDFFIFHTLDDSDFISTFFNLVIILKEPLTEMEIMDLLNTPRLEIDEGEEEDIMPDKLFRYKLDIKFYESKADREFIKNLLASYHTTFFYDLRDVRLASITKSASKIT